MKKASYAVWANPTGANFDYIICFFPEEVKSKKGAMKYAARNRWALCPHRPEPFKCK